MCQSRRISDYKLSSNLFVLKMWVEYGSRLLFFVNFNAHVKIVPLKCFLKLFVSIVVNNCASNSESPLTWVDIVSGYYYSNIDSVTWVCIHIEIDGTQFELLILHSKGKGWCVIAIDILELGYIFILWVSKIALYFVWIWPHTIYCFIPSKNPSCRCDANFESPI